MPSIYFISGDIFIGGRQGRALWLCGRFVSSFSFLAFLTCQSRLPSSCLELPSEAHPAPWTAWLHPPSCQMMMRMMIPDENCLRWFFASAATPPINDFAYVIAFWAAKTRAQSMGGRAAMHLVPVNCVSRCLLSNACDPVESSCSDSWRIRVDSSWRTKKHPAVLSSHFRPGIYQYSWCRRQRTRLVCPLFPLAQSSITPTPCLSTPCLSIPWSRS